jgi:hypothetical protein
MEPVQQVFIANAAPGIGGSCLGFLHILVKEVSILRRQLIDGLIDFMWVRDLTASMHLGLNNRSFLPHINQGSPEAPLKFQMAPKLKEPCSPNKAPDGPNA